LVIERDPSKVAIAFSGIVPFTIAIGLLIGAIQYGSGIAREARAKVYSQVAELMKSPRELGTLSMAKYAGPLELEHENETYITWNRYKTNG
jgi:hypothetical protein